MMKTMEKPIEETTKEDFLSQLQKDAEIAMKPIRGWLKNPPKKIRPRHPHHINPSINQTRKHHAGISVQRMHIPPKMIIVCG